MKRININLLLCLGVVLLSLVSCLKSGPMNADPSKTTSNVVEFANTGDNVSGANSTYPRFTKDLGSVGAGKSVTFNINLSYSGAEYPSSDITVTLGVDAAALATYNTENGTSYVVPPADVCTFPATAVIKQGTHVVQVQATVTNTVNFDFNKNYALPLKIVSATSGTISSNFGKAIYSFSARNAYDGIYTMSATAPMVDVLSAGLGGWYPIKMHLITYTGNSVALYDGVPIYTPVYGHPILSGTSGSYYGAFSPVFYFDNTGKITSVGNYYGVNAGGNMRSAEIDPAGVNKATFNTDGSIKSFDVDYIMTQSVSTPNSPRTYFHERFTYVSSR